MADRITRRYSANQFEDFGSEISIDLDNIDETEPKEKTVKAAEKTEITR